MQRFLGEIKSLNSGPDTCAGLVTKPVCPGINVRYTSVVKLHVSTTVCPKFYFFGHSVSMSLKNNSPKVHSNYWRAVMQGQRPFRFALIIVQTTNPCQNVNYRGHGIIKQFLQGNLTTFFAKIFSRKKYIWVIIFTRAGTE